MNIKIAISQLTKGKSLSHQEMLEVMQAIMEGNATQAQTSAFLTALSIKGETIEELTAAVEIMRKLSTKVSLTKDIKLIDTCGTGGDNAGLFNVSTAVAFVVAAAGGKVAKHGNRAITGATGSADVLEEAGINLTLTPIEIARCIEEIGVGFMFAPAHHSAMKNVAPIRKELGIPTLFNLIGPLTNPAAAQYQLLGIGNAKRQKDLAQLAASLGSQHTLVVHSDDGLDEISTAASTFVIEHRLGEPIKEYRIHPSDFNIPVTSINSVTANDATTSLVMLQEALSGKSSAARHIVHINAGAAIYCGDLCETLQQGMDMADDALSSGLAAEKWREFRAMTHILSSRTT